MRRLLMSEKRRYHVIIGSKAYFDSIIKDANPNNSANFLELVRIFDTAKPMQNNETISALLEKVKTSSLIIKNDNYHGIVESAHDRLGAIIEELTMDNAEIFVHNPPQSLYTYLNDLFSRKIIDLEILSEKYCIKRDPQQFSFKINEIKKNIIGQDNAINEISKSLWYLTSVDRKKPYVIMLYGNSSLGKTELVREIADKFFDGKYLEKHLSMFKNTNYSDYFFGEAPNRRSIGFDLLERDSNLIFFDELDKCPEHFYSAFYTLFDNTLFKDATYDVDISGTIIVLTSNYQTEEEMKMNLSLPVYYRIDKFIRFSDFSSSEIYNLIIKELNDRKDEFNDILSVDEVYCEVSSKINSSGENARTIKYKVQQVIEELLFRDVSCYGE